MRRQCAALRDCYCAIGATACFRSDDACVAAPQGQTAEEAAKIGASLQPESRAVIARLSKLRDLPDGAWKMHSGDLAHGEALNLDESAWEPIAPAWREAPNEAVWFRQTYRGAANAEWLRSDRDADLVPVSCKRERADAARFSTSTDGA